MKKFLIAYFSIVGLIIILGCGNSAGNNGDGGLDQGACFYSCSGTFQTFGCRTNEDISSSSECSDYADEQCDGSVFDDEYVSDCACQDSCAPSWYTE